MSTVILYSIQDRQYLNSILDGSYKPSFLKSYAMEDIVCKYSYNYMLQNLARKTNKDYKVGRDTCIWAWYQNPFLRNHKNLRNKGKDLVVVAFEVEVDEVVFSDFDIWCEMFVDGKMVDPIVEFEKINKNQSIQAVLWSIPKNKILGVESFNDFYNKYYAIPYVA